MMLRPPPSQKVRWFSIIFGRIPVAVVVVVVVVVVVAVVVVVIVGVFCFYTVVGGCGMWGGDTLIWLGLHPSQCKRSMVIV